MCASRAWRVSRKLPANNLDTGSQAQRSLCLTRKLMSHVSISACDHTAILKVLICVTVRRITRYRDIYSACSAETRKITKPGIKFPWVAPLAKRFLSHGGLLQACSPRGYRCFESNSRFPSPRWNSKFHSRLIRGMGINCDVCPSGFSVRVWNRRDLSFSSREYSISIMSTVRHSCHLSSRVTSCVAVTHVSRLRIKTPRFVVISVERRSEPIAKSYFPVQE